MQYFALDYPYPKMKSTARNLMAGFYTCIFSMILNAAPEAGTYWKITHPDPEAADLNDVTCGRNSRLVAVGNFGVIRVSDDDGEHWTTKDSHVTADLETVRWIDGEFLAVGGLDNATIVRSPNGSEWTPVCLPGEARLMGVASKGRHTIHTVAVGQNGLVLHSQNSCFQEWDASHFGLRTLNAVGTLPTGDGFVAVGHEGIIATSSNGNTWKKRNLKTFPKSALLDVACNASVVVTVGATSLGMRPLILRSDNNGKTWSGASSIPIGNYYVASVVFASHLFVAAGTSGHVITSTNGFSWGNHHQIPGNMSVRGLCLTGSRLVAVGKGGAIAYSTDINPDSADDWTVQSAGQPARSNVLGVAAGHVLMSPGHGLPPISVSRIVAVASDGTTMNSFNGESWFDGADAPDGSHFCAVADFGNKFLVVATGGHIGIGDGNSWTPQTSNTSENLYGVGWFASDETLLDANLGVAVGAAGTILTSPEAWVWTLRTSGVSERLNDVAVGKRRFFVLMPRPGHFEEKAVVMVVGENNTILQSNNAGETWTAFPGPVADVDFNGVAAAGTVFVAVGSGGTIVRTSLASGIIPKPPQWIVQTSGTTTELTDVVWTGTQWVVTGKYGTVLTSPDGEVWTPQFPATLSSLLNIASVASSNRLIAVGVSGIATISDPADGFEEWIAGQGVPVGQRGPDDDPNDDGVSNLLACALGIPAGTAATSADLAALPSLFEPVAGKRATLRFHPNGVRIRDVEIVVEVSTDLEPGHWEEVVRLGFGELCENGLPAPAMATVPLVITASDDEIHVVLRGTVGSRPHYFVRLRIELVP